MTVIKTHSNDVRPANSQPANKQPNRTTPSIYNNDNKNIPIASFQVVIPKLVLFAANAKVSWWWRGEGVFFDTSNLVINIDLKFFIVIGFWVALKTKSFIYLVFFLLLLLSFTAKTSLGWHPRLVGKNRVSPIMEF